MVYLIQSMERGLRLSKETRTVKFDAELKLEAYRFEGIMQKFPNHFHEHYVIGFIESGRRYLSCKNKEYITEPGDLLLFNPGITTPASSATGNSGLPLHQYQPDTMRRAVLK